MTCAAYKNLTVSRRRVAYQLSDTQLTVATKNFQISHLNPYLAALTLNKQFSQLGSCYNTHSNSLDKIEVQQQLNDFRKLGCLEEESVTLCVSHQTLSKPHSAQPAIVSRSHPHPLSHSADTHLQPKSYFLSGLKKSSMIYLETYLILIACNGPYLQILFKTKITNGCRSLPKCFNLQNRNEYNTIKDIYIYIYLSPHDLPS